MIKNSLAFRSLVLSLQNMEKPGNHYLKTWDHTVPSRFVEQSHQPCGVDIRTLTCNKETMTYGYLFSGSTSRCFNPANTKPSIWHDPQSGPFISQYPITCFLNVRLHLHILFIAWSQRPTYRYPNNIKWAAHINKFVISHVWVTVKWTTLQREVLISKLTKKPRHYNDCLEWRFEVQETA
jgi:hypothetical protein